MRHFNDIERAAIIMARERDRKRLETIVKHHKCVPATISYILSHYNKTGMISGGKSTGHVTSLDGDKMKKLDKLIKKKPTATANELANDVFEDTGKHVSDRTIRRYRRALGYIPHHQTIKKSLTLVQEKSSVFLTTVSKK